MNVQTWSEWINTFLVGGDTAKQVALSPPDVGIHERRAVRDALRSGYIAPRGPQLKAFETALAEFIGVEQVLAVNTGTAALHLALECLGVTAGDHVLVPDFTFIAAANPVTYLGATPVFVDVDPANWAMEPQLAEKAIVDLRAQGKRVTAMIVVHAYGIPAALDRLQDVARRHDVRLIEDCAGAIASYHGLSHVGTFGDAAAFSFNGNKLVTTGGGGAVVFKNPELCGRARCLANQGKPQIATGYLHILRGYNYRLSNVSAAIGLGQLASLRRRLGLRHQVHAAYRAVFDRAGWRTQMPDPDYGRSNQWIFGVQVPANFNLDQAVLGFAEEGVELARTWIPMHLLQINQGFPRFLNGTSKAIYNRFVCLPSGSQLRPAAATRIAQQLLLRTHTQLPKPHYYL